MDNNLNVQDIKIEWDENLVQFKDPVYGYIGIPKIYASHLIDTSYVQRLKGVAQSGIRSLFSSATHDRFSHSLGVYKFANMSYKSLQMSMSKLIKDNPNILQDKKCSLVKDMERWGILLSIAAIIHDIGHPVGSHSFEFLYDDIFLQLYDDSPENIINVTSRDSWEKQLKESEKVFDKAEATQNSYLNSKFKKALKEILLGDNSNEKLKGNPHERMSAYIVLKDEQFYNLIEKIIIANRIYLKKSELEKKELEKIDEDIKFICRMIIGQEYPCEYSADFDAVNYENSMRNCVIRLINGVLDADSMDYIMRNSYSAGYATHKVDYDRLCSAFSVSS